MDFKLGKKPFVADSRDFKFAEVAAGLTLPTPPSRFGHGTLYRDWGMLGNDQYGDCVWAGAAHETMLTNRLAGRTVTFDASHVLDDYTAVTGFNPQDPNTDQGTNVRAALGYRRATGLADAAGGRHQIGAYVAISPKDFDELMQAVYVFSAVGIGFEFPNTAMDQFNNGEVWDVVDGAQIEGGHYVPVMGRSSRNIAGVVTWGKRQGMTRDFYATYNDEAWAIIYPEELRNGKTERGFDLTQLQQALASLTTAAAA